MNRLTKYITILLTLCVLIALFAACDTPGSTGTTTRPDVREKKLSVVATIFPAYDWARQIIGENEDHVALTLLLDKGSDLHNYQPTVEDIYKISTCDLFIYVGGESDKWVPDALAQAVNKDMKTVCLLDALGSAAKEEEALEGMEDHEEEGEDEGPEYDEHVWLSLRNARTLCAALCKALQAVDPACADAYQTSLNTYDAALAELEGRYAAAIGNASRKTLLFADRFPFRYLADDYGLDYYAAFVGCSAETEASFETIIFLAGKLDELGLPAVLQIESADGSIARTVVENTQSKDQQILTMDSMQSTTSKDVAAGASYLSIMEKNLDVLKAALG